MQKEEEKSPAASGCASKWHGGATDDYCSPYSMSKRPRDHLGVPTVEEMLVLKNKPKLLAFLFACQFGVSGRPLNVHSFVVMPSLGMTGSDAGPSHLGQQLCMEQSQLWQIH